MPCGSSKDACNQDKNAANGHCAFEDLDHSVLQQPLNLGVTNIKQILKCVQSGSKEIKDIILNECNVIYECKACVGLFRSLANFMYHKRCYCKKHMCEDMLLFENFSEEEIVTVQPEAPKEKSVDTIEESSKMSDSAMDIDKSDIAHETSIVSEDGKSISEIPGNSKDKNSTTGTSKGKAKEPVPKKSESTMISKRTRDKNAQNPVSTSSVSRASIKMNTPEEPPLKCAKRVSEKTESEETTLAELKESDKLDNSKDSDKVSSEQIDKMQSKEPTDDSSSDGKGNNKQGTPTKEIKTKKIEFSKISGMLEKSMPSFPKIIFKTIESNQNAVFQSDDKKKIETFGLAKKFETATVETKVDNDKLIIVLKKDVKSDNSSDSKSPDSQNQKNEAEKTSDFHLTRKKRLMARNDCDVHELKCLVCKTQFMSLKTLYFHMLSLHSKKRLYYPCPFCKTLFVQMYGVTRHLQAVHGKTKDQIKSLREVIKKKSVWKKVDDVNPASDNSVSPLNYLVKEVSPPPEIKHEPPKETETENSDSSDSLKIKLGKNVTLHKCSKCNRVFGRKSSQVSHEKFCIMTAPIKTEGSDTPPLVQPSPPPPPTTPPVINQPVSNQSVASFFSSPLKPPVSPKPSNILPFRSQITPVKSTPIPVPNKQVSDTKISIRPKRGAEKQMHKDFVNSQTLKWRSANRVDTHVSANKTPPPAKKNQKDGKNLEKKVLSIMNAENLTCLKCDKKFSSYSNLRRHVAIHVGWTRFKCKFCDYQAYNKSQCWAHVQKSHAVDESEIEKSIVNLVNSNTSNKKSQMKKSHTSTAKHNLELSVKTSKTQAIPKVKISKKKVVGQLKISELKKQLELQKPPTFEVKKVEKAPPLEETDIKKEKPQPPVPPQKMPKKETSESKKEVSVQKIPKKETAEPKKEKSQTTITIHKLPKKDNEKDVKKEKSHHIIPIQKLTIPRETNYKSVTTSNPTTIILSKKIPSSTVQSIVTISPDSGSSTSKVSPVRTSPRKTEIKGPGERLITTLVTRSSAYTKPTPIQIKIPTKSSSVEELSKDSPEKNCSKKERLISEWFPKKDMSSSSVRRESAPLIIGLVPAGLNAKIKTPAPLVEKSDSSP